MTLREQFERETGYRPNDFISFDDEYIEWLENKLKELL